MIISLTFEQITIKEIKQPSCSNDIGRISYKAKISYSQIPTTNSYFVLKLKNSEEIVSSICQIGTESISPISNNTEESPSDINESTEVPNSDTSALNSDTSAPTVPEETKTDSPILPPTEKPNTDSPIIPPTEQSNTDSPIIPPTEQSNTDSPILPPTEKPNTDSPIIPPPINTEEPEVNPTEGELTDTPINPNGTEPEELLDLEDLKNSIEQLRKNLENNLNMTVMNIAKLDDIGDDLKIVLNFKIMNSIKKLSTDMINLKNKIMDTQVDKLIKPIDTKIIQFINILFNFDSEELNSKLNDAISKRNSNRADKILEQYSNTKIKLRNYFDELYKQNYTFLSKVNVKPLLLVLFDIDKYITMFQNITSKVDTFKQDLTNLKGNDVLRNNIIDISSYLDKCIKDIQDLIKEGGTYANINQKIKDNIKELSVELNTYFEKNEYLQIIYPFIKEKINISTYMDNFDIKDSINIIIQNITEFIKETNNTNLQKLNDFFEKEEFKTFLNNLPEMTPQQSIEECIKILNNDENVQSLLNELQNLKFEQINDLVINIIQKFNQRLINYFSANFTGDIIIEKLNDIYQNQIYNFTNYLTKIPLDYFYKIFGEYNYIKETDSAEINKTFYEIIDLIKNIQFTELNTKLKESPLTQEILEKIKVQYIDKYIDKFVELKNKFITKLENIPTLIQKDKDTIKSKIDDLEKQLK